MLETSISNNAVFDVLLTVKSLLNVAELFTVGSKSTARDVFETSMSNRFVFDVFLTVKSFATLTVLLNVASNDEFFDCQSCV